MKNKFKYLVKYSLKKKINTKWFKAVNVLLCLLIVFLINMDYVFTNAVSENIITSDEKDELIQIAKSTFYPKRNYSKTLNESNLDDEKKSKLINFIRTSPDIKKEDAKELIKYIAGMVK